MFHIELLYLIPLTLMLIAFMAHRTKLVTTWNLGLALMIALGVMYWIGPYQAHAIQPINDWIFRGYAPTWLTWASLSHLSGLMACAAVATWNLIQTGGKLVWR